MAAIVATMLVVPVCGALALLALLLFGVPPGAFVTFGGIFGQIAGIAAWWIVMLLGGFVYAVYAMPPPDEPPPL